MVLVTDYPAWGCQWALELYSKKNVKESFIIVYLVDHGWDVFDY